MIAYCWFLHGFHLWLAATITLISDGHAADSKNLRTSSVNASVIIDELNNREDSWTKTLEEITPTEGEREKKSRTSNTIREKRQILHDRSRIHQKWPNGIIPYSIETGLSAHARKIIIEAIASWQKYTCINFTPRNYDRSVLVFMRGVGCYSFVGRMAGIKKQHLSVGTKCEHIHTVAHEIGHVLGFIHTHNRADRDDHVFVKFKNVIPSLMQNFKRISKKDNENYGLPYDYGSVMHYSSKAFTANNGKTIIPQKPLYEDTMGSGTGPTFIDLLMVNKYYDCLENCKHKKNQCANDGYPNPRNCTQCICPSGFGGKFCDQKPNPTNCGAVLKASFDWKILSTRIGNGKFNDQMAYCYWWITTRSDALIEMNIVALNGVCTEGCIFGGVEIKADTDKRLTGYRFCCERSIGQRIIAEGPVVPVILFNRKFATKVQIRFRSLLKTKIQRKYDYRH